MSQPFVVQMQGGVKVCKEDTHAAIRGDPREIRGSDPAWQRTLDTMKERRKLLSNPDAGEDGGHPCVGCLEAITRATGGKVRSLIAECPSSDGERITSLPCGRCEEPCCRLHPGLSTRELDLVMNHLLVGNNARNSYGEKERKELILRVLERHRFLVAKDINAQHQAIEDKAMENFRKKFVFRDDDTA